MTPFVQKLAIVGAGAALAALGFLFRDSVDTQAQITTLFAVLVGGGAVGAAVVKRPGDTPPPPKA